MLEDEAPECRFEVPGDPKGLQRNRHRIATKKGGGHYVSSYLPFESRSEKSAIRLFASAAMLGRAPLDGPTEFRMTAFMPVPASWSAVRQRKARDGLIYPSGRPDLDNVTKLVLDAVQGVVVRNDAQVVSAHLWKRYGARPRIVVEFRCLGADGARNITQPRDSLLRPPPDGACIVVPP